MTKSKARKFWITTMVFVLMISGVLFFPQTSIVRALFGKEHIAEVLFRFWNDVLPKSEAGRYYQSLAEKHADELVQILRSHKEHRDKEFLQTIQLFIPGLEALVDGKGDTVQITEEQISSLKAEVEWIYSFASPALQEDIEKELQRFPLDNFIGMTMREALDYVNSNWVPGTQVVPLVRPTIPPTISLPICLVGSDMNCLEKPAMVVGSNVEWAYYTLNGIYLEFPSTWLVQKVTDGDNAFYVLPASESPEGIGLDSLLLYAGKMPVEAKEQMDQYIYHNLRPRSIWGHNVSLKGFQGVEFLSKESSSRTNLEIFFYNEEDQIAVYLIAGIKEESTAIRARNPDAVDKVFPNIQHMVESIRIWKP